MPVFVYIDWSGLDRKESTDMCTRTGLDLINYNLVFVFCNKFTRSKCLFLIGWNWSCSYRKKVLGRFWI